MFAESIQTLRKKIGPPHAWLALWPNQTAYTADGEQIKPTPQNMIETCPLSRTT